MTILLSQQYLSNQGYFMGFSLYPQAQSQSGTQYTRAGLVNLRDFYMVSGWLKCSLAGKHADTSKFKWDDNDDLGTIHGNIIEMSDFLNGKNSPFKDFRIETELNYEWKICSKEMTKPCPYYYTAMASLVAPIVLALATFSIMICLSKCCRQGNLIAVI